MSERQDPRFSLAVHDFRRARRRAMLQDILGRLIGRPSGLLPYEEVRRRFKAGDIIAHGVQEIPLDAIIGSVGRYADFTRSFLPRWESDEERWARLKVQVSDRGVLSPIKVYQIGEAYFVSDGHHRVSVARQLGATHIPAYVTEVRTKVPLSPQDSPDDLILKAEYAGFLERTHLDESHPEADLRVTVPGQYRGLEEQILRHGRLASWKEDGKAPLSEAAAEWYERIYTPVVEGIREQGILRDFPGRTETDLYLWVCQHRAELEQELGWTVRTQEAAEHLVERSSPQPRHVLARVGERIRALFTPPELHAGPPPGHWREEHVEGREDERLFRDILVALSGQEAGWRALDVALELARHEGARLHALHVVPSEDMRGSEAVRAVRAEFERRCRGAGLSGELAVEVGAAAQQIVQRARWTDLVVVSLSHPPRAQPMARLGSGLTTLLRTCPRPVLTVPGRWRGMKRALLAYDGSPKADEALYVATYLAGRWAMHLTVATVVHGRRTTARLLEEARRYLDRHGVPATTVERTGAVAESLHALAEEQDSDLILMGGYRLAPVLEVVLGSAVDEMLRTSRRPILICR